VAEARRLLEAGHEGNQVSQVEGNARA